MRKAGTGLTAIAWLAATQPAGADEPRNVALSPASPRGALLFKTRPQPFGQMLVFARNQRSSVWSVGHRIRIKATDDSESERYFVEILPPGEYRLNAVHQQQAWAACLEAQTLTVSVKAGEITYLGTLDTGPTLAAIQRNARDRNELSAGSYELHLYRSNVVPPQVTERDPAALEQARFFVRGEMPKSSAPLVMGDLRWGSFESSAANRKLEGCG